MVQGASKSNSRVPPQLCYHGNMAEHMQCQCTGLFQWSILTCFNSWTYLYLIEEGGLRTAMQMTVIHKLPLELESCPRVCTTKKWGVTPGLNLVNNSCRTSWACLIPNVLSSEEAAVCHSGTTSWHMCVLWEGVEWKINLSYRLSS